jgi:cytochrome b6-f complex iron-sulfur subunit
MEKQCHESENPCPGRREFLVKAGMIAGSLVLTISGLSHALANPEEDITVTIDNKSKLNKIGGSETIKSRSGKILVVRTGETEFKAFSAKCPHKGGPIKFDTDKNQLYCPWHDSIFGLDGQNISGPAKIPLSVYPAEAGDKTVVVKVI